MSSSSASESGAAADGVVFNPSARWGGSGHMIDIGGPVHYVEFGETDTFDRPPIVLVHGLGGSHLNWVTVAPALAQHTRVIAVDLAGFGLTPSAGRSATVHANAALLNKFLRRVVGRPAVIVGNSMGGMIALLHADANPDTVAGVILVDPSLPQRGWMVDPRLALGFLVSAAPYIGSRIAGSAAARSSPRTAVERVLKLCLAHPELADPDVVDASVALAEHRLGLPSEDAALGRAVRSLLKVAQNRRRYFAVMSRVSAPVLLLHGDRDRLVARAAADDAAAANRSWNYVVFTDVGHAPQLEVPDRFLEQTLRWLDRTGVLSTR